ncbi:MAG: hypothetical protein NZM42_10890 [Gemmatales bacterium]|nr:hypothetical protein [Gemmatales bacterium]MDW8223649.1 hypothetical protein [Gemmatales bacterium]
MTVASLPAQEALNRYFLELRCKLLDIAAILDRIDRGGPAPADPRLEQVRQALRELTSTSSGRAERIQLIFSRPYDPNWERPSLPRRP